jgi:Protein of unknown function (DUF2721)
MNTLSWQLPLLLAPIIGLLLISTSTRHAQIHTEIHQLLSGEHHISPITIGSLRLRVRFFRNALVALYFAAALLAVGSLFGLIVALLNGNEAWVIVLFSGGGILSFIYASITLIRESALSLEIFNAHLDDIIQK